MDRYVYRKVCRNCKGTGEESFYSGTLPHGKGDVYTQQECSVCGGFGVVDVIKEVTTTVVPVKNRQQI